MLMAARKLQGIGLVLIVLFLAMTLYPVSLRVASKRSELAQVERDIRLTRNNIRYLETEFGARASLGCCYASSLSPSRPFSARRARHATRALIQVRGSIAAISPVVPGQAT